MQKEWRCNRCQKLLGVVHAGRLHLRFSRGHEYLVGFPATSVCRGCQTINEMTSSHCAEHTGMAAIETQ
jgi:phage FluMu protein Com